MSDVWKGALWGVVLHALTWPAITGRIPWGAIIIGPPVLFFYLRSRLSTPKEQEND